MVVWREREEGGENIILYRQTSIITTKLLMVHNYFVLPPQESSGGGRKKKSKKDPNAPKKPLSAYMLWLQENRESIKRKYPGSTSVADVAKRAGEIWKTLTADDKAVSIGYTH